MHTWYERAVALLQRVVLDTNVIVSALLTPGRTPELCLSRLYALRTTILVDSRIEEEYRAVLARPKFASIPAERKDALLLQVLSHRERLTTCDPFAGALIDEDDRTFIEVALHGRAEAIITGNAKHYPTDLGFTVLTPAACLALAG